ncbi:adenosine deaminase [Agilicoccus flavus]|uniref:adenosine deaminase n=1 Tax=Agilicoccus flavus TaxID=2775968 RepID=UPI001CF61BC7|nr:adenosine deaminase [Agilicoccus flavus]
MSDEPTTDQTEREIPGLDEYLDPADQETRISGDETDDLPVTPPDSQPRASEREMAGWPEGEESIEQRIAQEVPDPDSAYGAPDNESGLDGPANLGGDDPDAIPADQDFLGDSDDSDQQFRGVDDPAEEDAIHVEGDEPL